MVYSYGRRINRTTKQTAMIPKSNCCGADIIDDYHYNNELCPKCGEHCEIEDIDDDIENDNWLKELTKVVTPKEKIYSNN